MNRSSHNSRRRFLTQCGTLASAALLQQLSAAGVTDQLSGVIPGGGHHPARAKRLIKVFLTGGFSHVDTFDPKPSLNRDQGRSLMRLTCEVSRRARFWDHRSRSLHAVTVAS